ncbi:hypothetical protein AKJ09_03231 [Labilithrix luteola]|uniref:Uncharacterized protein n=1 Tax=Labilithrix luteola TaxID=1391654 RepID=A0A0K1PSS4_9BACT|nr:hypothetical protein AKJ09_03231 [Labilithrix luteola]
MHWMMGPGALALAAIAACATSDGETAAAPQTSDAGGTEALDAQTPEASPDGASLTEAGPKVLERCSPGGWCATNLPDQELDIRDVRPFEERAFAVAESVTFGIQFLEWQRSTDAWKYISEGTQNRFDRGKYAGNMWAASENDVYFTVAPAFVYHGVRSDPASPFTWRISRLDDRDAGVPAHDPGRVWAANTTARAFDPASPPYDFFAPSLGVDSVPSGDVYAWYGPTLFRRTLAQNGDDAWVVEHVLTDAEYPGDHFHIQSVAGSGPDDLWIGGVRSQVAEGGVHETACPLVVRKLADGYHSFVDHVVNPTGDPADLAFNVCDPKPGALRLMMHFEMPEYGISLDLENANAGWVQSLQQIAPNTVVGLEDATTLVYLKSDGDTPLARFNVVNFADGPIRNVSLDLTSLAVVDGSAWMSGFGVMLSLGYDPTNWARGVGVTLDTGNPADNPMNGATFELSSIARSGSPLTEPLHQVRGTSTSNLWAVGNRHAFHKTTL